MKVSVKGKLARALNGNMGLNKKSLLLKKSWDEVSNLLKSDKDKKK